MRKVSLPKAAIAGVAGAVAWELVLRPMLLAGIPTFDIVRSLGTIAVPQTANLQWWSIGMIAHMLVGICWAVFYAHFFWARFAWRPPIQGLVFSLLPTMLAIGIMAPQLGFAQHEMPVLELTPGALVPKLSALEIAGIVLGHLIYGLMVGLLYTHPVGYASDRQPTRPPATRKIKRSRTATRDPARSGFIFATGIECSYPTIEGGRWRRDELAGMDHYGRWYEDFDLAREIGTTHLRYGPPLHLIYTGPGQFAWEWIDDPMAELQAHGPEPIVDLCHFGVPSWLGDFQNPDVPQAMGEFAAAFARRYPWVRFYTPVNEMYVCARFSALEGKWNEQRRDEGSFVTAVFNMAGASVAMTDAILTQRPDAIFVNSESSEFSHPCCPDPRIRSISEFENQRRFLALDLIYAHELSDRMIGYLREHGREDHYRRFMLREVPRRSIIGLDYYEWNERLIDENGQPRALGELFGWYTIASQYHQRYGRPLMHTETNRSDAADAPRWLWRQWHNVQLLRSAGAPLVGFTWYSLTDQIDWDIGLTTANGTIDPIGLFDLNREPRTVGLSYRHLIDMHRDAPEFRRCAALAELMQ